MTPEQRAKLPKYAQDYIYDLECTIAFRDRSIVALKHEIPAWQKEYGEFFRAYLEGMSSEDKAQIPIGYAGFIEAKTKFGRFRIGLSGRSPEDFALEISAIDHTRTQMMVMPRAANVIEIRAE